ncbi:MAG: hemerythrin domain-containing protein [Candidatus Eisenbacteria bacterium]|uniref:Hemerythrin domain-containing protein n=1 Tax=Eiseniibacteriota bacterium TaxID=2212470 RepID=A0A956RNF5_UNCEI|nr:hemerythrin domain-containing protein [Candidatus Eisenbacteria bacterium]
MSDRPERSVPGVEHDVQDEILHEHASLKELLKRLEAAATLEQMEKDLQRLEALLRDHFAAEEERLFPKLLDEAPQHDAFVKGLIEEHTKMIRHVVELRAAVEPGADFPTVVSDSAGLVAELRNHEERENEVILDTFFRDTGIGG